MEQTSQQRALDLSNLHCRYCSCAIKFFLNSSSCATCSYLILISHLIYSLWCGFYYPWLLFLNSLTSLALHLFLHPRRMLVSIFISYLSVLSFSSPFDLSVFPSSFVLLSLCSAKKKKKATTAQGLTEGLLILHHHTINSKTPFGGSLLSFYLNREVGFWRGGDPDPILQSWWVLFSWC